MRLGAIGAGMVFERYARACDALPGVEIVAAYDPDPARRAGAARPGLSFHESLEQLLAQPLDAVLVLAPNAAHRRLVEACLLAGVPTLCEKPLATTAADADAMVRLAEARQVPLFPAFHVRHRPEIKCFIERLRAPVAGFDQLWLENWRSGPSWYFRAADAGGGVLLDVGTNLIDWIGEVVPALSVIDASAAIEQEVELDCAVSWSFGAGTGTTRLSWRGEPEQRRSRVATLGGPEFELLHDRRCLRYDGNVYGPWDDDEYVAVLQELVAHLRAPDTARAWRAVSDLELIGRVYAKLGLSFGHRARQSPAKSP
jgi:predicted dehydrogenase